MSGLAFPVIYALGDHWRHETQYLGLALGLALVLFGAAMIVTARQLIVTEEIEDDYPPDEHPEEQEMLVQVVEESGARLTRRRLFVVALGGAAGAVGLAAVTPLASLGPVLKIAPLLRTPWRRGRRLVDEQGRPWKASDIEQDDLYTAFPEGASKEELGSPIVLVRLPPEQLRLPQGQEHYAAEGIVAYSKILHPRRLRDLAVPRAALPADGAEAGPRLPVPLLDVRSGRRRHGHLRARRTQAADAAAHDRPRREPPGERQLRLSGRAVVVGRPHEEAEPVIRQTVRFLDQRTGDAPLLRKTLRYLFPDHWSFLLGEVALYAFVVLVATGTYLALFFDRAHASRSPTTGRTRRFAGSR